MKVNDQQGFTLVETLVTFVILAGTILLAFQSMTDGLRALRQADEQARQINLVAPEVERRIATGDIAVGAFSLEIENRNWSVQISQLQGEETLQNSLRPLLIRVSKPDGPVVLETVILQKRSQ